MEEMKNLRDLLKHELEDLYSAEGQILEGLPKMIEKAGHEDLKTALKDHYEETKQQKARLDKVKNMLGQEATEEDKGFFANLFTPSEKKHCKAMEGLIKEAEKTMEEDMEPEVKDAAIIAAAQRIEHYEISGYGTAKAFALHLGLRQAANLLDETLKEEYGADSLLTDLALGEVNIEAMEDEGVKGLKKLPAGRKETVRSNRAPSPGSSTRPANRNGKSGAKKSSSGSGSKTNSRSSSSGRSNGKTSKNSSRSRGR